MLIEGLRLARVLETVAIIDCDAPDDVAAIERELNRR
jgi:hypothetical protein